jgi:predicted MPP superfamily phosphohydrolase
MPLRRAGRNVGGAGALAAGLAAWAAWFEPRRTVVRHVPLALPRWPRRFDGFRVALVRDLHAGGPRRDRD